MKDKFIQPASGIARVYVVTIQLTVPITADAQLQTKEGIRAEITSWLEDLGADVDVRVKNP